MKILVLDGFALNPGDLSWKGIKELGTTVVYDRTEQARILNRIGDRAGQQVPDHAGDH